MRKTVSEQYTAAANIELREKGKIGPDKVDDEIHKITRYDEWHNLVNEAESEDQGDTTLHDTSGTRGNSGQAKALARDWSIKCVDVSSDP
jgi:hypothetical protein